MSAAQIGILVPAVVGLVTAVAAYFKAHTHANNPVAHNVPLNKGPQ